MAVETTSAGTLITGESIKDFRLMTGIRAIRLEIRTGMKVTRGFSGIRFAKEYGYKGRSLQGALEYLEKGEFPAK